MFGKNKGLKLSNFTGSSKQFVTFVELMQKRKRYNEYFSIFIQVTGGVLIIFLLSFPFSLITHLYNMELVDILDHFNEKTGYNVASLFIYAYMAYSCILLIFGGKYLIIFKNYILDKYNEKYDSDNFDFPEKEEE
jgi:hypothetical protein